MVVSILVDEYKFCERESVDYWANTKKGSYGKGIINIASDPCKVTRIGLLGEYAFHKISGLQYNFDYKKGGDKHDFVFNNKTIDVKTASRDYGMCMAIYENAQGKNVFQPSDYFVLSFIEFEDRQLKFAKVNIVGFLTLEDVENKCRIKKSPRGRHKNYELEFRKATPIEELIHYVRTTNIAA